jgi:putative phosphoribosyl transferase
MNASPPLGRHEAGGTSGVVGDREIEIVLAPVTLHGTLNFPENPTGLVMFVHGSGSSRFSSRNRFVAETIRSVNLSTLLFDLLSPQEERIDQFTGELRFDIALLTERVIGVTSWLRQQPDTKSLPLGYFGASTGAAAALAAAAALHDIGAVVSRGGRPDLVEDVLPQVTAPTLLIVGGNDGPVIKMNRRAFRQLESAKEMRIVAGASHLFEEPGALEEVARLATAWFGRHLSVV